MKDQAGKFISGFMILFLCLGACLYFAQETNAQGENKSRKILYYRNPMDPSITSPTFMKDSMGMDYIPVYEETEEQLSEKSTLGLTVKISQDQQRLIGVKTEPVTARELMRLIRTVAKIAYDPELYKAEQELIQAVKLKEELKSGSSPEITDRISALVDAATLKLKLQGLSDEQIVDLKTRTESDRSLIVSDSATPFVWVYLTIYEYDLDLVRVGSHVTLKTLAFPGEEFSGKIAAIDPVLDMNTRSVRARVQIDNPQAKLKPGMYGDAFIHIDLGTQLAVPKEAVLDTGIRKIVYVDLGKGQFAAREVELSPEAIALVEGQELKFFPVIKGIKENEAIVTSGNFLIDSQSQLTGGMSALWGGATEIKQENATPETGEIKSQHRH